MKNLANLNKENIKSVPMHVLISSLRFSIAFFTKKGSARNGLAMLTMSAAPLANTLSATAGILIRFVVQRGMFTSFFSFSVTQVNALKTINSKANNYKTDDERLNS